jgi:hypothetical protein
MDELVEDVDTMDLSTSEFVEKISPMDISSSELSKVSVALGDRGNNIMGGTPEITKQHMGGTPEVTKQETTEIKGKAEEVVKEIITNPTECTFTQENGPVCSPKPIIEKMKEFIKVKKNKHIEEPTKVVEDMKKLLDCNSESCILKRPDFVEFAKISNLEQLINKFFKPEGPSMNFGLLSNFNIDDVLDQFEKKFTDRKFLHIPFQMRDFEKIGTKLSTIDMAEEFKTHDTFGVVINTDYSTGKGIHWFCLFGEKYKNKIVLEYFNSSGKDPLPEIQAWLNKTKHHLNKTLGIPTEVYYNTGIYFQNDDHSCGVYCLCYIWLRLEKVPPIALKTENFNDTIMHKARKNLFRYG